VADGGTLVLDEIGELPLELQAKLLRVLQSGEHERLGSTSTRRTDARVIASTTRDLGAMVRAGTFRPDLFYRLGVFPIEVPPLRERREDIPLLAAYFVDRLRAKLGSRVTRIPDRVAAELAAYDWPGNVRELENIVERSMIPSPGADLAVEGLATQPRAGRPAPDPGAGDGDSRTLDEVERDHILAVCGHLGQLLLLPACAAPLLWVQAPEPWVVAGMILLAASPGGPISNVYTYLGRGNVALSVRPAERFTLLIEFGTRNLGLVAIVGTLTLGQVKLVLFATMFFLVELALVVVLIARRSRLVGDQARTPA
jgi:hypothetical protein